MNMTEEEHNKEAIEALYVNWKDRDGWWRWHDDEEQTLIASNEECCKTNFLSLCWIILFVATSEIQSQIMRQKGKEKEHKEILKGQHWKKRARGERRW